LLSNSLNSNSFREWIEISANCRLGNIVKVWNLRVLWEI